MTIKFFCDNGHWFHKTEQELRQEAHSCRFCWCGEKLHIKNVEEVIIFDLEERVKNNIDKYFKELGIEGTIELIERNNNSYCYKLYKSELERRGFKLKED